MKLKLFTYILCASLVVAMSLFPTAQSLANYKIPNPFTVDWYDELGTCNDGSTLVDSELLTFDEFIFYNKNGEIVKIIDHISGDARIYVKEKPYLVLEADPFKSMSTIYLTPEVTVTQSGSVYKITIPGLGRVFSATGRAVWEWDDTLGEWVIGWSRGNWTPMPKVVNALCTYFGLQ